MSRARSKPLLKLSAVLLAIVATLLAANSYLERTREISGIWLYQFENSNFFEGATGETIHRIDRSSPSWLRADNSPLLDLTNRTGGGECWRTMGFEIRFVGRKLIGPSGHFSSWWSEYVVEEVISVRPVDWPECDDPNTMFD
ncbi:hypothetical protein [Erythrobacter sp. THAF29]|uniref:hypothetical protein n=1 Tax=Erythrobacter sp. THAF29 TaxID=2587851 RepID=UPI001267F8CC|nr:hypothetical protein [Erythrobacter sp. THAF29]